MHHQGVGGVPVGCEEFFEVGTPLDGGYLGGGLQGVQPGAGVGVPDVDSSVVCAAARGEEGGLPGTPCYRLRGVGGGEW